MICQFYPSVRFRASSKDPLSAADGVPILAVHPSPMFLQMPSSRPTLEAGEEVGRALGEGLFTHFSGVIATPAANDWVEMCNQSSLGSRSVGLHNLSQSLVVLLNLVLGGSDECFEAKWNAPAAACMVLTRRILTDVEAEEIEP